MAKPARRRRSTRLPSSPPSSVASTDSRGTSPSPLSRSSVFLIFTVALVIRLVHSWQIQASPFADFLLGDSASYDRWAQELAGGDWFGSDVFYQAPLYPYFLGAIYALVGTETFIVRIVQALLGASSAALLALAGARFFSPRVGLGAGIALAVYAPAIFMDATLQKSVLDLFLLVALLWLISLAIDSSPPPRLWLTAGASLGALGLSRENALVLLGALAVWFLLDARDWTRRLALVAGGLAIVLIPVAARNAVIGGEFHLTTSQFGPNFYIGNNGTADGTYRPLRFGRGDPLFERRDATELAEEATGQKLSPSAVSRYWTSRTLADIVDSPRRWLGLLARKALLTINAIEVVDTESQYAHAEHSVPLAATGWLTHFGVLIPLALVGLTATWRRRTVLAPLYLMFAFYAASVVGFYVFARYRYPLVPFVLLFATAGGNYLWSTFRRESALAWRPTVIATVIIITIAANWPLLSKNRMRAVSYNSLATAYREQGGIDDAIRWYEHAISIDPNHAAAHSNLASALTGNGATARAIEHYERALALEPATPDFHFNYGNALLAQERYDAAAEQFQRVLDTTPDDSQAYNNLGMALGSTGRMREAANAFSEAARLSPDDALAHRNLATALIELGDISTAQHHLREAERLSPPR